MRDIPRFGSYKQRALFRLNLSGEGAGMAIVSFTAATVAGGRRGRGTMIEEQQT